MKLAVAILVVCATAQADPSIARVACPTTATKPAENVECFALTVPANRSKPSAKTITIPIARFRTKAAHPLEPIVFLAGGPGVNAINHLERARRPWTDDHDFIMFQQRGGKYSQPELDCPEWTTDAAKHREQAAACGKRLLAAGVDLDGYDTAEIVADLFDMQRALALPSIDLFGVSYGTRVALEALRAAPTKTAIHAVVLDSVLPPDVRYDEVATDNVLAALDHVFDRCASDPACAAAYPKLRARWQAALGNADAKDLIDAVADELNVRTHLAHIPKLVDAIARGERDQVKQILADNAAPSSMMRGERLSVWCRDEAPITDWKRVANHPELGGWQTVAFPADVCAAWPVTPSSPQRTPVASDVPSLIFTGEYDPNTPPAWAQRAHAALSNSSVVAVPNETHVAANGPCPVSLVLAFLRDPRRSPDLSCIASAPALHFD